MQRRSPPHLNAAADFRLAVGALRQPWELGILFVVLATDLCIYWSQAEALYRTAVVVGSLTIICTLAASSYLMASKNALTIWSALFWFRISCLTYFGFGAIVPYLSSAEALNRIYASYYFDDGLALKVSIIYTFGILLVLAFSDLVLGLLRDTRGPRSAAPANPPVASRKPDNTPFFALLFLCVGGFVRYGVVMPYAFGLLGDTIIPGVVITAASSYFVGIYLLVRLATARGGALTFVAAILIVIDVALCLSTFAKTELLTLLIFAFLGVLSDKVSLPRVIIGASVIAGIFVSFQPLVEFGRGVILTRYGSISGAPLAERLEIVSEYFQERIDGANGTQSSLSRLSYVYVTAFVVDQYDSGRPGNTLLNGFAALVPRALWPDKPIISQLGQDLYLQMSGRRGSSTGTGHFAEAYWNFGWWGLPLLMAPLAAILALFSRFAVSVMARKDWLFLPVVLIGVMLGIRSDGQLVVDVVGPAWTAAVVGWLLHFARLSFLPRTSGRARTRRP